MILIQKWGFKSPRSIQFTIIIVVLSIISLIVPIALANNSMLPYLLPSALLVILVLTRPILGFYFYFFILMLVPYWVRAPKFRFLNSPLEIVTLPTIFVGSIYFIAKGKQIHFDKLLFVLCLLVTIMFLHVITQHGPNSFQLFYRFMQGSIPLILIILLVDNPRHIRNILIAGIGSVVALVILWLPFMITYFFSPWFESEIFANSLMRACHGFSEPCNSSIAGILEIGGPSRSWTVAMITPLLLNMALSWPSQRLKRVSIILISLCTLFLIFATFYLAIIASLIGILPILFAHWRKLIKVKAIAIIGAIILIIVILTPIDKIIQRGVDGSIAQLNGGSGRLNDIKQSIKLIIANPVTGIGGYLPGQRTSEGDYLPTHSTIFDWSYKFGIPFGISLLMLFMIVITQMIWLLRQNISPEVRCISLGMLGGILAILFLSIINPGLGSIFPDNIFWLYSGVASTWVIWLRRSHHNELIR